MRATLLVSLMLCLTGTADAQSITLSGIVKDKSSLAPLDSARVEIVNTSDPTERFSVVTNSLGTWSYTFVPTSATHSPELPDKFSVEQNYPNPFNPSTKFSFSTDNAGSITFTVHNAIGQLLDRMTTSVSAGNHVLDWTSKGAAGVLFLTVDFDGARITRKMIQLDGHGNGGLGHVTTYGGVSPVPGIGKLGATSYSIAASRILYMPDTAFVTLTGNTVVDFSLETVHSHAYVFDLHNDLMETVVLGGYQMGVRNPGLQSDLPRFQQGGVDAEMFAIWTRWTDSVTHPYYPYSLAMIDTFNSQVRQNASQFAQGKTYQDLMQLNAIGKFAGVLAIEGGHAIENSLEKLKAYYALGARYMTITWNNSTVWAVSAADPQSSTIGLNEFGRQVIKTMDSLGMIIDVSHTGVKTIWDILATTKNPIIASHSGVRALNNHYRNLNDAQIDSIARRGGVIGVVFHATFLSSKGVATIDTVIKHIDYIKNRVGIDCIAIGSDYDGGITPPVALEDVSKLPNLTAALLRRGYSIEDVHKILGGNYLRVFKQVCR
jgi:membrane dipeptidase